MSSDLKIASAVLKSDVVPYKYTVYSPKTRNSLDKRDVYEFIDTDIGISTHFANRVLQPPYFEPEKG